MKTMRLPVSHQIFDVSNPVRAIFAVVLACALAFAATPLRAASIPVPNGDFSASGNIGQVGGGLLGASGTDVAIGTGPWTGSYNGVLGLLAPPQLTIASGGATISGLAGVNVLGVLNNGGYFSQTLPVAYIAGNRYTLAAQVDIGSVLDLGLLGSANLGLALRSDDGTTLASTATAAPPLINLTPIGGTAYRLTLAFDAQSPISGDIDIQLLATPQGMLGASLSTSVGFSDVTLDVTAIDPSAGQIFATGGAQQSATVGTPFAAPLDVQVVDANGDPLPNVAVTFAAPASGAGVTLSATTTNTDADGIASVGAIANDVAGSYVVNASVAGVASPAVFTLTNLAAAPASITTIGPGAAQSTEVLTAFPNPLVVAVTDAFGNPVAGVAIDFVVPASGAGATLSSTTATTDATGLAQVAATANAVGGAYAVTASVVGVAETASFALTNTLPDGTTVDDGGGQHQSANLGSIFACALEVDVAQPDGTPYAGVQVQFEAPSSGASAVLFDGVNSGTSLFVTTGANGAARVRATANEVAGDYLITATLIGADDVAPVTFALRNIESLVYADGFDTPCRAFP